ncbi:MAG: dihydrodipicolinate synthase family protein [Gemmatales bacterium]|nr:dihydrodipicolinate synthase family protein [Gemmatales bacterium]MDW8387232.1 dihydrodipicolinate synthase family protein [Gemmatales bacterium]
MNVSWQGVFPAVATQFRADASVDAEATLQLIGRLVDDGVHGLILLGTVGENCSLEYAEKLDLLRAVIDRFRGRAPILTGVAECSTRLACRFAEDAARLGVDGLMVLPAMVYKADVREAVAHYRAVASASDRPIMIYNNPVAYQVDLPPAALAELADEPRFVAVKESSENVRRITDIKIALGDRYRIFVGVDDLVLESVLLGACGWVSGLVNAFPRESVVLWELATSGRWQEALKLYRWFTPLLHLDTHVKLVQYIKLAMAETGLGSETVRPPRLPLVGREREEILGIIRQALLTRPTLAEGDARHARS